MNELGILFRRRLIRLSMIFLGLVYVFLLSLVPTNKAAAVSSEPDTDGTYNYLQIAETNTLRVYAKSGETINFTILVGYGSGSGADSCGTIYIKQTDGITDTTVGHASVNLLRQGGTIYSNSDVSGKYSTCSGANNPYQWVTLSYKVPQNGSVTSMDNAYKLIFTPNNGTKTDDRSYKWRITVTGTDGQRKYGRVWFVGNDSAGLKVHQDDSWVKIEYTCSASGTRQVRIQPSRNIVYTYAIDGTVQTLSTDGSNPSGLKEDWNVFSINRNSHTVTYTNADGVNTYAVPNNCSDSGWNKVANPMDNATSHSFQFVRTDGYRYKLQYDNYQGIWSAFHGGVYGARTGSSGSTNPAYRSYDQEDGSYHYKLEDDDTNVAYIFVDCYGSTDCPNDLKKPDGTNILRAQPITNDTVNGVANSGNPIGEGDNSYNASSDKFRYTGYASSGYGLAGGTVYIPYTAMQTGYITLTVTVDGTTVCQKKFFIDEADGQNTATWSFTPTTTGLGSCDSGTWKNASGRPTPFSINSSTSHVTFTAQAAHLGEMHFIDVDTEQRGGIEVTSNDQYGESSKMLGWYDPFSRVNADVCGTVPLRVADGGVSSNASGDSDWDSMSSGRQWGIETPVLARKKADSTGAANGNRRLVGSSGGVHGWTFTWKDGCDAYGGGGDDGHSNEDGTATSESTWGNNRVVDDWTYAYKDPAERTFSLGGSTGYSLSPSVSVSPSPVIPGDTVTGTPSVTNTTVASAKNVNWEFYEIILPPGMATPAESGSGSVWNSNPCPSYVGSTSCGRVGDGSSGSTGFDANKTTQLTPYTHPDTSTLAIGSHMCYLLVITPSSDSGGYRTRTTCVIVAAAPYMSVIGGNVWAGGSTDADSGYSGEGVTIKGAASARFGSFGEYGVFATGTIDYFGSAAGIGKVSTTTGWPYGTKLTFGSAVSLGNFTDSHKITDLVAKYATVPTNNSTVLSDGGTGTTVVGSGVYGNTTPLATVGVSGISGKPKAVIYVPDGTVLITNNIVFTYDSSEVFSFKDLPSLTIIAKNIYINGSVSEIDGNLYASNKLVTCYEGPWSQAENGGVKSPAITNQPGATCNNKLVINGTVTVANNDNNALVLNRSYGGTKTGEAAETIRMRPESFLTDYEDNTTSLLAPVSETELPARY